MTRDEFVKKIEEMGITNYQVDAEGRTVRVIGEDGEYYRVSQFDDDDDCEGQDGLYVRDNGICGYKPEDVIFRDLEYYARPNKADKERIKELEKKVDRLEGLVDELLRTMILNERKRNRDIREQKDTSDEIIKRLEEKL